MTRVTGSNPSEILGVLGTYGNSNPNLFLINPNGIIFGANASLNVGGSFLATTANAIQFGNIGTFSATTPDAPSPLLTINPSALLFNQIATAPVQNNSMAPAGKDLAGIDAFGLRVPDGKSLLLVGGNINMDGGQLNAYGGLTFKIILPLVMAVTFKLLQINFLLPTELNCRLAPLDKVMLVI